MRNVPLKIQSAEFRRIGHRLVDDIARLFDELPGRPVVPPGQGPEQVRAAIDAAAPLPENGAEAGELIEQVSRTLIEGSLYNGHPQFYGYITSSPAPIGALADLLAAAVNPNVGGWTLSPVASEIETQTVRWLSSLIGYRDGAGGVLVSGGNMANFLGFLAARTAVLGQEVRSSGLQAPTTGSRSPENDGRQPVTVYGGAGTHTWIDKATDLFGLGTDAFRRIGLDDRQRMRTDLLRDAIALDASAGLRPLMVVATAGSVSTGAVDPIREIAEICREQGLWLHVDGAYGGFAAAALDAVSRDGGPDGARAALDLAALAHADSVAIDPHKWLYAPLEAGCTLARDPAVLRDAFSYHPPYYHFGIEANNYVDFGLQNSRGFRALKVWLQLKQVGRSGYVGMIGDDIALAKRLHHNVSGHPELEAVTHALSIVTFRHVPSWADGTVGSPETEERLNRHNEALLDRLQKDGAAFVSNAVVDGRYLLRACIVNFNTDAEHVDALPDIVVRAGRALEAEAAPAR